MALNYHNKETIFLRPGHIYAPNNYVRLPQHWNTKVAYPHRWVFCRESSILTLLAHRLVWKVGEENTFSNVFHSRM